MLSWLVHREFLFVRPELDKLFCSLVKPELSVEISPKIGEGHFPFSLSTLSNPLSEANLVLSNFFDSALLLHKPHGAF